MFAVLLDAEVCIYAVVALLAHLHNTCSIRTYDSCIASVSCTCDTGK